MANNCNSITLYARQELTTEDMKFAAEHLNETDETREIAITEIRHWIEKSDDLPARIDDFFISRFLRVCKFDLEKTKSRIRNYYKQRSDLPEWYKNMDPFQPKLQELLDLGIFLPLRKPDSQGRIVIIMRGTRHDPKIHNISDLTKVSIMAMEAAMKHYPAASVYGYAWFVDVTKPSTSLLFQCRSSIRNWVHMCQSCYPTRYKKIILFNVPRLFEIITTIFKSFMTEKFKSRFHVYSNQDCFEDIPANILPVEYGGAGGTLQELTEYWKKCIEENRDWFTEDENDKIE